MDIASEFIRASYLLPDPSVPPPEILDDSLRDSIFCYPRKDVFHDQENDGREAFKGVLRSLTYLAGYHEKQMAALLTAVTSQSHLTRFYEEFGFSDKLVVKNQTDFKGFIKAAVVLRYFSALNQQSSSEFREFVEQAFMSRFPAFLEVFKNDMAMRVNKDIELSRQSQESKRKAHEDKYGPGTFSISPPNKRRKSKKKPDAVQTAKPPVIRPLQSYLDRHPGHHLAERAEVLNRKPHSGSRSVSVQPLAAESSKAVFHGMGDFDVFQPNRPFNQPSNRPSKLVVHGTGEYDVFQPNQPLTSPLVLSDSPQASTSVTDKKKDNEVIVIDD